MLGCAAMEGLVQSPRLDARAVHDAARELEGAPAEEILAWAAGAFGDRLVLTCSWQRQSSVLVHLVASLGLPARIVEIDTGLLFPETHATREALVERYGIEVETLAPRRTPEEQAAVFGPRLWERDPDRCCAMRKVAPLERALADVDGWITGIRREQSPSRRDAAPVELDRVRGVVKVQPLVAWTRADVETFIERNAIPFHPLHAQGFPSIGCTPCTRAVRPGEDERAGRWAGSGKTECGLHARASA